jgi:hypothetical protein
MNDPQTLHELEKSPLSDTDIHRLVNTTIVRYPELRKYELGELLKSGSCVILFLTKNAHDGHWVCLIDHGKYLEFFCSFGIKPDGHFKWLTPERGRKLDGPKVLGPMLKAAGKPVVYNTHQFQDIDLDAYKALMGSEDPDDWVTEQTSK